MKDVEHTVDEIICRDRQISLLKGLLRKDSVQLPNSIFVYGLADTGKSLVVNSILRHRGIKTSFANCIEFYSPRIVFESLLNQITGEVQCGKNRFASYVSCDNISSFVQHVKEIAAQKNERYAFVFEQSERLRDCDANLFPSLCRLQELCDGVNLCVIFFSRLPLDKFRVPNGFLEPVVVHFPQYNKEELVKILLKVRPWSCLSEESYKNYVNLLLSVFFLATRNLSELKHLAELNLKAYCEPILSGEVAEDNLRHLWKNIEPKLKKALSTIYLREVTSAQFNRMQELTDLESKDILNKKSSMSKMELPYYSKFLLLASYIASYNPAKTDKRFFSKNHGKQRKTMASIKAKQKACGQLTGPKPFPLDRLMAIFYAIIEDKVAPTSHLFSQVSTLVSLRLLTPIGCEDALNTPKYKSNVSLDFIRSVARTVNFEIVQYLYDFSS